MIDADPPIFVAYSPSGVALKPTQPSEDAAVRQAKEHKKQAVEAENADDDKVKKKTKASPLRPKK